MSLKRSICMAGAALALLIGSSAAAAPIRVSFVNQNWAIGNASSGVRAVRLNAVSHSSVSRTLTTRRGNGSFWDMFATRYGTPGTSNRGLRVVSYQVGRRDPVQLPARDVTTAVPEPTGALLFAAGFGALALRSRRRRS